MTKKRNPILWLAVLAAVLVLTPLYAQQPAQSTEKETIDDYIELLRKNIRNEKTSVLKQSLKLTPQQAELFWPIYRESEKELQALGDDRVASIKEYSEHYDSMTDEKADELVQRRLRYEEKLLALKKKYYERVKKALGARTAARFLQVETQLVSLVDLQVMASLPILQ